MRLDDLAPAPGARKKKKRLGRGSGSGHGKTAGRGTKGQKSRSGGGVPPWFEGGQMPLQRRVPKRGFYNPFRKVYAILNIADLARFGDAAEIGPELLKQAGIWKSKYQGVKLLAEGKIDRAVTVKVHKASGAAVEKITAAGGRVELISE